MALNSLLYPVPFESLLGFMSRLGSRNHYEGTNWYKALLPPPITELNLLRSAEHYNILSRLTLLSTDVLQSLTLSNFAPIFNEMDRVVRGNHVKPAEVDQIDSYDQAWSRQALSRYVRGSNKEQVCPLCWLDCPTFLLPWSLRIVTTCPRHLVLLVDRCAKCNRLLRLDVVTGTCAHCAAHLSSYPTTTIEGHWPSILLTSLVWRCLGLIKWVSGDLANITSNDTTQAPSPHAIYDSPFPSTHPLRKAKPATLLSFLWRFSQVLTARDPTHPLLDPSLMLPGTSWDPTRPEQSNPGAPSTFRSSGVSQCITPQQIDPRNADVAQLHGALVAIFRLLYEWPESWYFTLGRQASAEIHNKRQVSLLQLLAHSFSGIEWEWLANGWRSYMEEAIKIGSELPQSWLYQYRCALQHPEDKQSILPEATVWARLRCGRTSLRRLTDAGLIVTIPSSEVRRLALAGERYYYGYNVKVFVEHYITAQEVADLFGVSKYVLMNWVAKGVILPPECAPLTVRLGNDCLFGRAAIIQWRHELLNPLQVATLLGVSVETIYRWARLGVLPAHQGSTSKSKWFLRSTVAQFAAARSTHLTTRDAATILGITPRCLLRWVDAGWLKPAPSDKYNSNRLRFAREDIQGWRRDHVTTEEAAELLGMSVAAFRWHRRTGKLLLTTLHGARDGLGHRNWYRRSSVELQREHAHSLVKAREATKAQKQKSNK